MKIQVKIIIAVASLVMAVTISFSSAMIAMRRPISSGKEPLSVVIEKGSTFATILGRLTESKIVKHPFYFKIYMFLDGGYRQIKPGYYEFPPDATALRVLQMIVHGETAQIRLSIPEGYNIYQIGRQLARLGVCESREFVALASNYDFIEKYGLPGPTLEGYLFPDTYFFSKNVKVERIVDTLIKRYLSVWSEKVEPVAKRSRLSQKEIMTLASIVEKETGNKGERAIIASVFFNRLQKGMRLQSDPTTIYGVERQSGIVFTGKITKAMLRSYTPYNTYTISGLPPGPIANPGLDSIKAVLAPEDTDYYYFVSRNDGSHRFTRNLGEHNSAVNRYQRSR